MGEISHGANTISEDILRIPGKGCPDSHFKLYTPFFTIWS